MKVKLLFLAMLLVAHPAFAWLNAGSGDSSSSGSFSESFVPSANNVYDIGSGTNYVRDVYVAGTIYGGRYVESVAFTARSTDTVLRTLSGKCVKVITSDDVTRAALYSGDDGSGGKDVFLMLYGKHPTGTDGDTDVGICLDSNLSLIKFADEGGVLKSTSCSTMHASTAKVGAVETGSVSNYYGSSYPEFTYGIQSNAVVRIKQMAAPSTPSSGVVSMYLDSSDGNLKVKFDDGDVVTIATNP